MLKYGIGEGQYLQNTQLKNAIKAKADTSNNNLQLSPLIENNQYILKITLISVKWLLYRLWGLCSLELAVLGYSGSVKARPLVHTVNSGHSNHKIKL